MAAKLLITKGDMPAETATELHAVPAVHCIPASMYQSVQVQTCEASGCGRKGPVAAAVQVQPFRLPYRLT